MNKQNPNPPKVTFRVLRGRVVPIVQGKQPRGVTNILKDELEGRKIEIEHAEAGKRNVGYDGDRVVKSFGTKSTFPGYYSKIGFKNKDHFMKVINNKKGPKFAALVEDSIGGLLKGRTSSYGKIPPSTKFRVATKQEFDNRGVVFRKINGVIVPLRPSERVPF